MRTDTVYNMMKETRAADPSNFRNNFQKKVLGITVLTGYNNATYRIDDVDFEKTPMSTFKRRDAEITIADYYIEVSIKSLHKKYIMLCHSFCLIFFFIFVNPEI